MADSERPVLQQGLDFDDFDCWYWTVLASREVV